MSLARPLLSLLALPLRLCRRNPLDPAAPRILVIRRNRLGDMLYTVPLLHALRRHYPHAHITVACDAPGVPIARACAAVDEVHLLDQGVIRWIALWKSAAQLQDHDWVIAAKGGFDRRLALLTRLTNAPVRIGFERHADRPSACFTDPVALPLHEPGGEEHQIDTLMRLLQPLGLVNPTQFGIDLSLSLPTSSARFAKTALAEPPFAHARRFLLINLSSTVPLKFREEEFIDIISRLLGATDFAIGLVSALADQARTRELAHCLASPRLTSIVTPGPLDLAALLKRATVLLTPEGGAAHLAAAMGTPAVVLWSEGPFQKWHSRAANHAYVHAQAGERAIPADRVWQALQPFLDSKNPGLPLPGGFVQ